MGGYWPSSFFCAFIDRHKVKNKNEANIQQFDPTSRSIRIYSYGQKIIPKNFDFAGTKQAFPSGQDRPILRSRVANQNTGFASPCPLEKPH